MTTILLTVSLLLHAFWAFYWWAQIRVNRAVAENCDIDTKLFSSVNQRLDLHSEQIQGLIVGKGGKS